MKSSHYLFFLLFFTCSFASLYAQTGNVSINTDGSKPDSSAILDVQSAEKGVLIPRMDSIARKAIPNPAIGLMVFDVTRDHFWFYGKTGWREITADGEGSNTDEIQAFSVSSINDTLFLSQSNFVIIPGISQANASIQDRLNMGETPCEIYNSGAPLDSLYGKTYRGGLIFYLDINTCQGLVAAPANQSMGVQWAPSFITTGAFGSTVFSGEANTSNIVTVFSLGTFAASVCDTLTLGDFSDWYLPAFDEVGLLYQNLYLKGFGNLSSGIYWSSTELNGSFAVAYSFMTAAQAFISKDNPLMVRAIRRF